MRRSVGCLLAIGVMCGCDLVFSTVGSWTVEAAPPRPITTNNVVALADGRVAIFGGLSLQTGQESAQTVLYDPVKNTWSSGAPMPGPAFPDVVVRLQDGTVLVEGGQHAHAVSGASWVYDPTSNRWTQAGNVNLPRSFPSFTLLNDGRVLIVGGGLPLAQPIQLPNGTVVTYQPVATAEIFDPLTKAWTRAGRLRTARNGISLVPLEGGRALAAGGCQGPAGRVPPVETAEVFDPSTATWTSTTSLPTPLCGATGVALRDGRALIVDQFTFNGLTRYQFLSSGDAFAYDPKSRGWSQVGALVGGGTTAVALRDGRVLVPEVQPGAPKGRLFMETVGGQIFDPASNQWTFTSSIEVPQSVVYVHAGGTSLAVSLPDGAAVVMLQTVTLGFDPNVSPPSTQVLDSAGLTVALAATAAVIGVLLLIAYARSRRTDLSKLA